MATVVKKIKTLIHTWDNSNSCVFILIDFFVSKCRPCENFKHSKFEKILSCLILIFRRSLKSFVFYENCLNTFFLVHFLVTVIFSKQRWFQNYKDYRIIQFCTRSKQSENFSFCFVLEAITWKYSLQKKRVYYSLFANIAFDVLG